MKTIISIACLVLLVGAVVEARPKRSIIVGAPLVASPVVASVPVVHSHSVVQTNPSSVVKTEQVHDGAHSSYSYSSEVRANPVVHTHSVAAVAAAAPAVVSTVHHTVPTYAYSYYPSHYGYYSPYHYLVGK